MLVFKALNVIFSAGFLFLPAKNPFPSCQKSSIEKKWCQRIGLLPNSKLKMWASPTFHTSKFAFRPIILATLRLIFSSLSFLYVCRHLPGIWWKYVSACKFVFQRFLAKWVHNLVDRPPATLEPPEPPSRRFQPRTTLCCYRITMAVTTTTKNVVQTVMSQTHRRTPLRASPPREAIKKNATNYDSRIPGR